VQYKKYTVSQMTIEKLLHKYFRSHSYACFGNVDWIMLAEDHVLRQTNILPVSIICAV